MALPALDLTSRLSLHRSKRGEQKRKEYSGKQCWEYMNIKEMSGTLIRNRMQESSIVIHLYENIMKTVNRQFYGSD